jgi:hypothetical protein
MAAGDQQYYMNPTTGQWQPTPYVAPAPAAAMPDQLSPAQLIFQQAGGNPADSASLATWMSGMYGGKPPANYTGQVDPATALGYYISKGGSPNVDVATATSYYNQMNPATKTPESNALTSIAKTDPTQAAITTGLENSYNQTLAKVQAQQNTPAANALNPALQAAYLKSIQQGDAAQQQALAAYNDPKAAALRAQTQAAYGSALGGAQNDYSLGTKLDPALQREIQQYVRGAQVARGNDEGGAQTVQEAMTQGSAGLALRQQRLQALESATQPASAYNGQQQQFLGQQQAYAGATQQAASGFLQAQQQYLQQVQQQAAGYLGSGQTKYGQATTYLNNAINQQAAALGGYPIQQNAQQMPPSYLYINPAAGNTFSQGTQGFMQQGVGATTGSPGSTFPTGAVAGGVGTVLGGLIGSLFGGVGAIPGAAIGGAVGTAAGAGIQGFCWIAREVFGGEDPKWLIFRDWMRVCAPQWLRLLYAANGQVLAGRIKNKPRIKRMLKAWMESALTSATTLELVLN